MGILIDLKDKSWMEDSDLKQIISSDLPGVSITCGEPKKILKDVIMAIGIKDFDKNILKKLPNLRLIQKVGAGVENMLSNSNMPKHIKICRMSSKIQAKEMAEYCLAEVLAYQRNIREYFNNQSLKMWKQRQPLIVKDKSVSILGLGLIGMEIAQILQNFGFTVFGWSRTVKPQLNFKNYNGINGLITVVSKADYVISVLPETNETKNLLSLSILRKFKPGSVLINVGRGSVINEEGLIKVLSEGILGGATLDVFQQEPLPKEHPFWTHPKIVITPHVSGWNVEDAIETIPLNYYRLIKNEPLLFEIDQKRGY
ncbi:MAG: hypothetical protein CML58_02855 [Rhodobacteraceae bacterium]|nr:hypothetical protein [Paracoccaceae bacterium]